MHRAAAIIFFISLFVIVYTYAGYPLILFLLVKIKKITARKYSISPNQLLPVALIVAAYNEEKMIRKKIDNTLALTYPHHLLTVIFVTDGSADNTPAIVNEYKDIIHLHEAARRGKLAAINRAVALVTAPVIVFSDANTFLNADSIMNMVRHYSDPSVGAVAGEKRVIDENMLSVEKGEGLYWRYESLLKKMDSQVKTTVGAAGELFSIRTSLYSMLPENTIIEDFVQSLMVCVKGYVVRYEPDAYGVEAASLSIRDEMERKIRIAAGGFQAMGMLKALFNFFRYRTVSFLFISHRVLRWALCPACLILLFVASAWLTLSTVSVFYGVAFVLQLIAYVMAAAGWCLVRRNRRAGALYIPFYFTFMNFCVLAGFLRFVNRTQTALWQKADR